MTRVLPKPPRLDDEVNRREFLSLMAASMALAGLGGCAAVPPEKIVPYVVPPEQFLPGKPLSFATAMDISGYGVGLIVEGHEGRPIKVEGNPDHPASLGATDAFAQASLLTLYDPDRAQTVTRSGQINTWEKFLSELRFRLDGFQTDGQRFRILTESVSSPTVARLLTDVLSRYPGSQWHQYEPVNQDNARAGAQMAFGRYVDTQFRFDNADVVLSLDSDFLMWQPGKLRYAREFARRRKAAAGEKTMSRLYVVESSPTITGASADHRFPMRSSDITAIARAILMSQTSSENTAWLGPIIEDLESHRGRSIVIAGDGQPAEVHAMAHAINNRLGNVGQTVVYTEPVCANPQEQTASLRQLADDMKADRVDTLVVLGGNPVYTAPVDLGFSEQLGRVPFRVHHNLYYDETSTMCHWHIPQHHYLEAWGDVRAYDGTASIIQPLIIPLYQSRSVHQMLAAILGEPDKSNYDIVREQWQREKQLGGAEFEPFWNDAVRRGLIAETSAPDITTEIAAAAATEIPAAAPPSASSEIELVFRPDAGVFDGRWSNNAWLQELPRPITHLVWDNAALMSPATAGQIDVRNDDVIELKYQDRAVLAPVLIVPGHADRSITIQLGYGRLQGGRVGTQKGFNAYMIRTSSSPWIASGVQVRKTGDRYRLISTQRHHDMEARPLVRHATLDEYAQNPNFARNLVKAPEAEETLYPQHENVDYAWGMAIDLSTCIGCNACVAACQAENNIPVVGKSEVSNAREMHWLRIDTYFEGDSKNPQILFEPMACQHCETAPCEVVCPTEATSHSAEGINEMTYNRCVGTRYCSNNCPYKVRRFNFFEYTVWDIPQFKLLYNPDVTVRSRGVMEKCTYCIQRINRGRIEAKKEDRLLRDGEVVTACQAVCPAEAIVFGNIQDPDSAVSNRKAEPRNYGVLAELNTRPRTSYLAKLRNPNPKLV